MPEIVDVKAMSDDEFVKKYKKLAYNFVWRKYGSHLKAIKSNTGLEIEDLIQCGMIGLLKARKEFNPTYGCEFSTFAIPKMHGETTKAIINNQKVKITSEIFHLKGRIIRKKLIDEKPEVISQQLGVSVEVVEEALQYQQIPSSLNELAFSSGSGDTDLTLEQMLIDERSGNETEKVEHEILVNSFVQTLPDREMIVWDMYSNHMSQESIGKKVGVSQTQISRILKRIEERAAAFGREQGVAK
ncbi:sigma-70 family RNA polymerase sigma factor [Bacillus wiedmannii]|uniref:sigma-70 family RNA polymerase sigma factor n=1 Tax=Bacillus wiedmannii TaxID=1890302 RepID=UPI0035D8A44E